MRVFLSYRRLDDLFLAGRLRDRLAEDFGEENIFFDVDSIPPGTDFREVTRERIDAADVVLALIGSRWDASRLARANDYVRMELDESLRQHKSLIPVLIADTAMPTPDELPDELVTIAFLNALRIRPDPDFHDDCARLVEAITDAKERELARVAETPEFAAEGEVARLRPAQATAERAAVSRHGRWGAFAATARRRRWVVLAATVAAAGGLAVFAWTLGRDSNGERQFEIAPNSGPVGTTIELHGDGCPAKPNDAVNQGINYWLDSPDGAHDTDNDVQGDYDKPWTGSLVVPDDGGSVELRYWVVGAACWATYSNGNSRNFYEYQTVLFNLTPS